MIRYFSLSGVLLIFINLSFAQVHEIPLSRNNSSIQKSIAKSKSSIRFSFSQDKILSKTKTFKEGSFADIWLKGSYPNGEVGTPNLPAYKKLIRIPKGSTPSVRVVSHTEQLINLKENGINLPIYPNQLSVSKNQDSSVVKLVINKSAYSKNSYSNTPIATIEMLGNLRSATIARLVVNPINYNPADGLIKVYNDIDVDVSFENVLSSKEEQEFEAKTYSPYFEITYKSLEQPLKSSYTDHPDLTKYPVKMLIISNRMFEQSLQPFIQWKKLKGFNVKTLYTDDIGGTAEQIKTFIQQEYNSATPENPAPSFLVIAGDVDWVPASADGSETGKLTDLYYASVDGDMFPDMYYGRLSATTTFQLDNIINKILYYEKYQFEDPSYLNKVTLIAGVDATWNPSVGQPTIKYGTANYFNQSKGFTTVNEYGVTADPNNPNASPSYSGCYGSDQMAVGLVNYTAHCSETSWVSPSLSNSSIAGLTNTNRYPLAIGNCCLSGDFGSTECIGEAWVRAQNKGSVTYIGSSPNTYWLEDFYWSVGAFPLAGNNDGYVPTYQETTTGMYDAPFVSNYVTTGGMVFAGNLAVTEVNIQGFPTGRQSSSSLYYWQAYNIIGDPSLIPYFTEAETNQVFYNPTIILGESTLNMSALANSYIAISKDDQLIGTAFVNKTGEVSVPITPILSTGEVAIVITRPQTIPIIDNITAISPTGPYLMLDSFTIDDQLSNNNGKADYNESFGINLKIKNVGINDATDVKVKITGTDDYINIQSNDSISVSNIPHNKDVNFTTAALAYTFRTLETIPDQHVATFTLKFYSNQGSWSSKLRILLNSPVLTLGNITIDSHAGDNGDNLLSPGESCRALVQVNNEGHALARDITFNFSIPESIKSYVSINSIQVDPISLEGSSFTSIPFRVSVNSNLNQEFIIPLTVQAKVVDPSSLSATYEKSIKVIPNYSFKISNDTVKTCFTYFYDSGGKTENYKDSENYTATFVAGVESNILKVKFIDFNTEAGYDFLYVYDGPNTNTPQVNGSPFSGSSIPNEIISSSRFLTFKFNSDGNKINKGWEATIQCIELQVPSCATTPSPYNGANLVHTGTLSWTPQNFATYYDVYLGTTPTDIAFSGRVNKSEFSFKPEKSKTYYWKVIPANYSGLNSSCSNVWSFTTDTICGEVYMSTNTISVDTLLFYDSGGPAKEYRNDENYKLTIKPKYTGNSIKVNFLSFNTENGYDTLSIYNGLTVSSPLIGTYSGLTSPGINQASNSDGALTFVFKSDINTVQSGWKAIIESVGAATFKTITLKVQSNSIPISNASVAIDGTIKTTNSSGFVTFTVIAGDIDITANALGYKEEKRIIPQAETNSTIVVDLEKLTTINIHVFNTKSLNDIKGVKVEAQSDSSYTSSLGRTALQLIPGTYTLYLSLKGYTPYSQQLIVDENNADLEISLTATKHLVKFLISDALNNPVEDAIVSINDTALVSNSDGVAIGLLSTGNYATSISRSQFLTQSILVYVDDNLTKKISLDDTQSLHNIEFTFVGEGPKSQIPINNNDVDLYYNNKLYSRFNTDAQGKGRVQLLKGDFNYFVNREGYYSINNKSLFIDGNKSSFQDTLYQKTYSVQFSVDSQLGSIQNASITLNGYTPDFTDASGQVTFSNIGYEKKLSYTVQRDEFFDAVGTIDVVSPLIVNITLIATSNEIILRNSLKIYPNPTSNQLYIESERSITRISVINTLGVVVLNKEGSFANQVSISMGNMTPGVYILIINAENSVPEKALIIKK